MGSQPRQSNGRKGRSKTSRRKASPASKGPRAGSRRRRRQQPPSATLLTARDQLDVISCTAGVCVDAAAYLEHDDLAMALLHGVLLPLREVLKQLKGGADMSPDVATAPSDDFGNLLSLALRSAT
jgi:hypothetical protein